MKKPLEGGCFTCGSAAVTMRERLTPRLRFCGSECHVALYDSCVVGMTEIGKRAEQALIGDYIEEMAPEELEPILLRLRPRALLVMAKASFRVQLFTADPKFRLRYMKAHKADMSNVMASLCYRPDIMLDWMPQMLENKLWNVTPGNVDNFLNVAASNGRTQVLRYLLEDGTIDPGTGNSLALTSACENGSVSCVQLLLADKRVHPDAPNCEALSRAVAKGHVQVVKVLLVDGRINPGARKWKGMNFYLAAAVGRNHAEIVQLLLQDGRADPTLGQKEKNDLVLYATEQSTAEIVRILLRDRRVTPPTGALFIACEIQALEIIDILLTDGRVNAVEGWRHFVAYTAKTWGKFDQKLDKAITERFRKDDRIRTLLQLD